MISSTLDLYNWINSLKGVWHNTCKEMNMTNSEPPQTSLFCLEISLLKDPWRSRANTARQCSAFSALKRSDVATGRVPAPTGVICGAGRGGREVPGSTSARWEAAVSACRTSNSGPRASCKDTKWIFFSFPYSRWLRSIRLLTSCRGSRLHSGHKREAKQGLVVIAAVLKPYWRLASGSISSSASSHSYLCH